MVKKIGILLVLIFSFPAMANPTCYGKVTGVSMSSNGNVLATVKNTVGTNLSDVVFCNLNSLDGAYSGEACDGVMSLLISANAMDKNITLWFDAASFDSCEHSWMNLNSIGFYHVRISG